VYLAAPDSKDILLRDQNLLSGSASSGVKEIPELGSPLRQRKWIREADLVDNDFCGGRQKAIEEETEGENDEN